SQVMVGPLVRKCAEEFFVSKFFVGTDGFSDAGIMSTNLMRAEAVRSMASSAKQVIVLTESEKFSQLGVVALLPYKDITAVYTDDQIPADMKDKLQKKDIQIHTVSFHA
ncbi:MAG: DeoR/GlpR transcriptional regulator, partial [Selenomonas sp.]|nr:DeoR/GlpR transcriptional regulator [Selenomonas sp.]